MNRWQLRSTGPQLTAFNPLSGTRISFGPTPERLQAPELLDVKLTDVCSVGCTFCYQDSHPGRSHARLEDVAYIATEAGKAGVFEAALGGGEVSEYPHFREALHLFRAAGVVPNFTTRRMRWLARQWKEVRELVGGVAVSLGSAAEIRLLDSLIPATERRSGQLVAQVVMGTVERPELPALMQAAGAAGIRVTLLGFKDVGRGQSFRPLPYGWWLDDLPQYTAHTQVSIDTALAAECPAELEKLLLPGSYHTEEGRFSAYADAVSMTLAPSSYHAGPVYPFDAEWLSHFAAPDFVQGPSTPPTTGRVRLGFATNSSSSHSLVLFKDKAALEKLSEDERSALFTTKALKDKYLASKLLYSILEGASTELIHSIFHELGLVDYIKPVIEISHNDFVQSYDDLGGLLEEYGAPESRYIENDSMGQLGLALSEEDLFALKAFRKILMRDDMALKVGYDSNFESYREQASEDIISMTEIWGIGQRVRFYASQILEVDNNLDKPFIQRVIDVAGQLYGEVFADNLRQLAQQDFSISEIAFITSEAFGNYIYTCDTDIKSKISDFLPPKYMESRYLEDILNIRLRMTADEFLKFAAKLERKYGKDESVWSHHNFDFPDKQSGFTTEEMMEHMRKF